MVTMMMSPASGMGSTSSKKSTSTSKVPLIASGNVRPSNCALIVLLLMISWSGSGVAAARQQAEPVNVISDDYQPHHANDKCERITMKMCADIPYNSTFYPNSLKHQSQKEAEQDLGQFEMLVNVKCSVDVKFFLCTLYAPVCTQMDFALPPCRHLCLSAKNGCEGLMQKFGFKWPEMFDCGQFPESGMCVGENRTSTASGAPAKRKGSSKSKEPRLPELECPHVMKILSPSRYSLRVANRTIEQCSLPCTDEGLVPVFLGEKQRNQLKFLTSVFATLSCFASLVTVLIFSVNLGRFEYPERSIFFLSICTLAISGVYVYGTFHDDYACGSKSIERVPLVTQGVENWTCTVVAVIHYYASTAMYLWWLNLCFSWFLVTTMRWGEAPVGRVFSSYFHVFAWGAPSLMVIAVLVMNGVDGDMFSSICSVGNLQPNILFNFVVLPQAAALAIGFILFFIGLISIIRIRSYIKGQPKFPATEEASQKLSRLMVRMTLFVLLFVVSALISILASFYQAMNLDDWLTSWYSTRCLHAHRARFGFTQPREQCPLVAAPDAVVGALAASEPHAALFFAKHLPFFVVGLAFAVWTLNSKTYSSFKDCWNRQCHKGRSRVPTVDH